MYLWNQTKNCLGDSHFVSQFGEKAFQRCLIDIKLEVYRIKGLANGNVNGNNYLHLRKIDERNRACQEKINHVLVSLDHECETDLAKVKILQQVSADLTAAVSKNVMNVVDLIDEMMEKSCHEQVLSFMKDLEMIQQDRIKVQKVNGVPSLVVLPTP